jgi:hypothetical protein
VEGVEEIVCRVVNVAVGPAEKVPPCIGSVPSQDLTNCTDSGVEVVEVKIWWNLGECSWMQKAIRDPSEAAARVGEGEQEAGTSPLVVAGGK